jgi:hypothetical protein
MTGPETMRIAAIAYQSSFAIDKFLTAIAKSLRARLAAPCRKIVLVRRKMICAAQQKRARQRF